MTVQALRERHLREPWSRQLGNLASTLARLGSRSGEPRHDVLTTRLLREAAHLIDWSAPHVAPDHLVELVAAQRELCLWAMVWPLHEARPLLALRARTLSDRLLEVAGFVPPTDGSSAETGPRTPTRAGP